MLAPFASVAISAAERSTLPRAFRRWAGIPRRGKTAPDFKGAIGVTHDNVEGVDIIVPVFKFTATKVFAPSGLPNLGTVYSLTGKVNAGTFSVTDTITGLTIGTRRRRVPV